MLPVRVNVLPPPVRVISEPVTVTVLLVFVEPTNENPSELSVKVAVPDTAPDVLTANVG